MWQRHGLNRWWPLRDFLELGALPSAVPCARLHARQVLWEWGIGNLGDSAELLVTELITNAVRASREAGRVSAVRLWLLSDSAQVLILVWDSSPRPPVRTDAGDEAEHGRGLMLVDALSEQWGWYSREDSDGKVVWAITRLCVQGKPRGGRRCAGRRRRRCATDHDPSALTASLNTSSTAATATWLGVRADALLDLRDNPRPGTRCAVAWHEGEINLPLTKSAASLSIISDYSSNLEGKVRMRLRLLGTESGKEGCPALYATDRGTYVVQGKRITDPEAIAGLVDVREDEGYVEIPPRLLRYAQE
jgi:anti-sigma regulatory factor (Ser/Thr protein kinase)